MKRILPALSVCLAFAVFFVFLRSDAYAVVGDLNYNIGGAPQQCPSQSPCPDLSACTNLKNEAQTHLASCQKANALLEETHEALKNQKNVYMWVALGTGLLALCLGSISLVLALKLKKQTPAPQA